MARFARPVIPGAWMDVGGRREDPKAGLRRDPPAPSTGLSAGQGGHATGRQAQPLRRICPELPEEREGERETEPELPLREGDENDRLDGAGPAPELRARDGDEKDPPEERGAREIDGDDIRGAEERGAEKLGIEEREDEPPE